MSKESVHIKALSSISKAITSDLYLENILKLIVTVTAQVIGSKLCSLMLLNDQDELVICATQSVSKAYLQKQPIRLGEGIGGKVALEGLPVCVYDVNKEKDFKYKDTARKEGIVSLLCVPLSAKDRVIGIINLYTSKPRKFTENEICVVAAIASQAALVIQNTELMVKTKVVQEEMESRKLIERAQDILMQGRTIDEQTADRLLRKISVANCRTVRQTAEAVILSHRMKDPEGSFISC